MEELLGIALFNLITIGTSMMIRCQPLKEHLRVSKRVVYLVIFLLYVQNIATFYLLRDHLPDGMMFQAFTQLNSLPLIVMPFVLTRQSFLKGLFLISVDISYVTIVFGFGNYAATVSGVPDSQYYLIFDAVVLMMSPLLLPLLSRSLKRLMDLWPDDDAPLWRVIWLIPVATSALCILSGDIYVDGSSAVNGAFLLSRLISALVTVVTCFILSWSQEHFAERSALAATAHMSDRLLALQGEQYDHIAENIDRVRIAAHDFRHQMAVIRALNEAGNQAELSQYLDELMAAFPSPSTRFLSENYAAGAIANHYMTIAQEAGIPTDVVLDIPRDLGPVTDTDLCIVLGNLLENAIEACRLVPEGDRFIRARAATRSGHLTIRIENSSAFTPRFRGKKLLSSKRDGEGIGLNSVKIICKKYSGLAQFEMKDGVWCSSALMKIT